VISELAGVATVEELNPGAGSEVLAQGAGGVR
jgi:hypothetical protein